jgi:formate dehydrogenase
LTLPRSTERQLGRQRSNILSGGCEILECFLDGRPIREEYLIVDGRKLAGAGAHSYSPGDATGGADEAARFKAG